MTKKTVEEMFEYAKNLADTDENTYIGFFVESEKDIDKLRDMFVQESIWSYKNKGSIRFDILPLSWKDAFSSHAYYQYTHIFINGYPNADVFRMLWSRCDGWKKTYEPSGMYFSHHVLRREWY